MYEGLSLDREIVGTRTRRGSVTPSCSRAPAPRSTAWPSATAEPGRRPGRTCASSSSGPYAPARRPPARFERLLDACERLAAERGLGQLDAGVNLGRPDAYRRMIDRGFRTWSQGVTMHRPNEPGYSHPDAYVIDDLIDDWR